MARRDQWRDLGGGLYVRPGGRPGEVEGRRVENVRASREAVREQRQHMRRHPKDSECITGGLRQIGALTNIDTVAMQKECGNDFERQQCWMRDHPEVLTVPVKEVNFPKKRRYSYRGQKRRS